MSVEVKAPRREIDLIQHLRLFGEPAALIPQMDCSVLTRLRGLERILGVDPGETVGEAPAFPLEEIPLDRDHAQGHPLAGSALSTKLLGSSDLKSLTRSLGLHLSVYESGAIPAASNPASDYSLHSWTRDSMIIALAMARTGHSVEASQAVRNLAAFYGGREQRNRFVGFHYDRDPVMRYRFGNVLRDLPHVRVRIDPFGRFIESEQHWSHQQLDAIGMWIYVTFLMANRHDLDLREIDHFLSCEINPDNRIDSIFSVVLRFLNRIKFWEQYDYGAWEDRCEPSRASSIGICIAGLQEVLKFFRREGWGALPIYNPAAGPSLETEIQAALNLARTVLNQRISRNGGTAMETERFPADAALSFLLFPFNPGLTGRQQRAILTTLYRGRMGTVGFTRRDHDEYLGSDYIYNPDNPCFGDPSCPGYRAAEWTLFDPLLASYYYQRYIDSSALDRQSYLFADRHLKRTLLQFTSREESFTKLCGGQKVSVPARRLPEAYWYDSREQRWRPNENSPLLMAEAAAIMMFERAMAAAQVRELSGR